MTPIITLMKRFAAALILFCGVQRAFSATTSLGIVQVTQVIAVGQNAEFQCRSTGNGADPRLEWLITYADGTTYENITYLATTIDNTNLFDGDVLQSVTYPIKDETIGKLIFCNAFNGTNYREQQTYTVIIQTTSVLGGSCSQTSDCGTLRASCDNQVCRCQTGYFDTNGISTSGGSCQTQSTVGQSCITNVQDSCRDTSVCNISTSKCVCISGYTESSGSCVLSANLGGFCTQSSDCGTFGAFCNGFVCECQTGYYDTNGINQNGGSCETPKSLGQSCSSNIAGTCSAANSVCDANTITCQCNTPTYTQTGSNTCSLATASLGQSCGSTVSCGTTIAGCVDGICQCLLGYFNNDGTCQPQSTVGQSCNSSVQDSCGDNSVCSSSTDTCVCISGYQQFSGSCIPYAGLGQSCTSFVPCTVDNSQCIGGVCSCGSGYYAVGNTQCLPLGTYGSSCTQGTSSCSTENLVCGSNSVCVCANGYTYSSSSGSCVQPTLGGSCTTAVGCLDTSSGGTTASTVCLNNVCACPNSHYYGSNNVCYLKATLGGSCLLTVSDACMDPYAVCNGSPATCSCPGTVTSQGACTNSGVVLGTYGSSCTIGTSSCSTGNLVCGSNSVCVCANGYTYSSSSGSCVQPNLGESCGSTISCGTSHAGCISGICQCLLDYFNNGGICQIPSTVGEICTVNVQGFCTGNSVCSSSTGKCVCNSGYTESFGSCVVFASLGQACGSTLSCGTSNAGCVNGICQCLLNYSSYDGKCQLETRPDDITKSAGTNTIVVVGASVASLIVGVVFILSICWLLKHLRIGSLAVSGVSHGDKEMHVYEYI